MEYLQKSVVLIGEHRPIDMSNQHECKYHHDQVVFYLSAVKHSNTQVIMATDDQTTLDNMYYLKHERECFIKY